MRELRLRQKLLYKRVLSKHGARSRVVYGPLVRAELPTRRAGVSR